MTSLLAERPIIGAQSGHALVGALMPEYDPVTKISIVPRGQAGGLTFFAPSEERLESGLYRCAPASFCTWCKLVRLKHARQYCYQMYDATAFACSRISVDFGQGLGRLCMFAPG